MIGEELGLLGLILLLGLYAVILWRVFRLARQAAYAGSYSSPCSPRHYLLVVVQALFHFAVNLGVATKGLTLPDELWRKQHVGPWISDRTGDCRAAESPRRPNIEGEH